jgi:hypothetical protein
VIDPMPKKDVDLPPPVGFIRIADHEAAIEAAVLAEREACAEVVESLWAYRACQEVADAVRARTGEMT